MASIRQTASGYEVMYRTAEHGRKCRDGCSKPVHQHSRKFTSERDATKFRKSVEAGLSAGLGPVASVLDKPKVEPIERTFVTHALDLIERKGPRGDWTVSTQRTYRSVLNTQCRSLWDRPVSEVADSRADVSLLVASATRPHATLNFIRAVCRDAINHGHLDGHRLADIATEQSGRREIIPSTRDQVAVIAATLDAWRSGAGLMAWLGDGCGLRIAEVRGLKVSDFRNNYGTLRVARQVQDARVVPLKAKRAGSYRDVPVSSAVADHVRQHVASLGLSVSDRLFAGPKGGYHRVTEIDEKIRDGAKAAGLPPAFTFHQLRHGFATRLLSAGVPVTSVSQWMGHSATQTTEIYSHVLPDAMQSARAIMDALG